MILEPMIREPMLDILFDEKICGSFHFTPGQAYEEANNGNESQVHWDMVNIQREDWGGGEIWFDGQDVLKMHEETLRKFRWSEVSIVFQSAMNSLNPVISIGEQMTDVLLAHQEVSQEQATERAAELLKVVGIHSSRLSSFPHQLSGGMRQRVVIAIALALNPKLIIMDEPTTALDVVVEREIMEELYDLKEKFGFSVLFISHDLSLMGEISDRIGVMYAGRLVELGTAEQIMNSPQHPYTKGLLSSFPTIHGPKVRLEGIPGNPVNLLELPNGCAFQERCGHFTEGCGQVPPALLAQQNRQVACFNVEQTA